MENTVINTVSPEDLSRIFDSVGVTGDQIAGSQEDPKDDTTDVKPITDQFTQDFTEFDSFVKTVDDDAPAEPLVDLVAGQPTVPVIDEDTPKPSKKPVDEIEILGATFQELIKEGIIEGFEDGEPIKSKKELKELILGNIELAREKAIEEAKGEIIQSLPRELHLAAEYAMKGGKDMKSFFKAMANFEEIQDLDLSNEQGQENIVRLSLEKQGFTADEIDSEIFDLKDSGKLEAKAKLYKPKLDAAMEKEVQSKIQEQEEREARRQEGERIYKTSVFEALKEGEVNGIKLDKKMQGFLFNGLTNNQFKSITGGSTNLLGALLEKIQFIEPNYKLLAEATWLLSDPEGYRKELQKNITESVTVDTVRKIKSAAESSKTGSKDLDIPEKSKSGLKRSGFFKSL